MHNWYGFSRYTCTTQNSCDERKLEWKKETKKKLKLWKEKGEIVPFNRFFLYKTAEAKIWKLVHFFNDEIIEDHISEESRLNNLLEHYREDDQQEVLSELVRLSLQYDYYQETFGKIQLVPLKEALIEFIAKTNRPFNKNIAIIAVQHILQAATENMLSYIILGVPPKNILLKGKIYSTNERYISFLRNAGILYCISNKPAYIAREFSEIFTQELSECIESKMKPLLQENRNIKDIMVVDDGNNIAKLMLKDPGFWADERFNIRGTEQTSQGCRDIAEQHKHDTLSFNTRIFLCAAWIKTDIENIIIDGTIFYGIMKDIVQRYGASNFGIAGLGNLGQFLAYMLSKESKVKSVIGFDISKFIDYNNINIDISHDPKDLFENNNLDVIIDSTGVNSSKDYSLKDICEAKEKDLLLGSVSSKNIAFSNLISEAMSSLNRKVIDPLSNIVHSCSGKEVNITILLGGYPLNFEVDDDISVDAKFVQHFISLLSFKAFVQALFAKSSKEPLQYDPFLQLSALRHFLNYDYEADENFGVALFNYYPDILDRISSVLSNSNITNTVTRRSFYRNRRDIKETSHGVYAQSQHIMKYYSDAANKFKIAARHAYLLSIINSKEITKTKERYLTDKTTMFRDFSLEMLMDIFGKYVRLISFFAEKNMKNIVLQGRDGDVKDMLPFVIRAAWVEEKLWENRFDFIIKICSKNIGQHKGLLAGLWKEKEHAKLLANILIIVDDYDKIKSNDRTLIDMLMAEKIVAFLVMTSPYDKTRITHDMKFDVHLSPSNLKKYLEINDPTNAIKKFNFIKYHNMYGLFSIDYLREYANPSNKQLTTSVFDFMDHLISHAIKKACMSQYNLCLGVFLDISYETTKYMAMHANGELNDKELSGLEHLLVSNSFSSGLIITNIQKALIKICEQYTEFSNSYFVCSAISHLKEYPGNLEATKLLNETVEEIFHTLTKKLRFLVQIDKTNMIYTFDDYHYLYLLTAPILYNLRIKKVPPVFSRLFLWNKAYREKAVNVITEVISSEPMYIENIFSIIQTHDLHKDNALTHLNIITLLYNLDDNLIIEKLSNITSLSKHIFDRLQKTVTREHYAGLDSRTLWSVFKQQQEHNVCIDAGPVLTSSARSNKNIFPAVNIIPSTFHNLISFVAKNIYPKTDSKYLPPNTDYKNRSDEYKPETTDWLVIHKEYNNTNAFFYQEQTVNLESNCLCESGLVINTDSKQGEGGFQCCSETQIHEIRDDAISRVSNHESLDVWKFIKDFSITSLESAATTGLTLLLHDVLLMEGYSPNAASWGAYLISKSFAAARTADAFCAGARCVDALAPLAVSSATHYGLTKTGLFSQKNASWISNLASIGASWYTGAGLFSATMNFIVGGVIGSLMALGERKFADKYLTGQLKKRSEELVKNYEKLESLLGKEMIKLTELDKIIKLLQSSIDEKPKMSDYALVYQYNEIITTMLSKITPETTSNNSASNQI